MSNESDRLLAQLGELARRPLNAARAMPPGLYNSPEIHALERDRIFAREWHCPGLAADIPDPGDYLTFSIGDEPIFVARGRDGVVRGFSNVCRHRMMRLLEGRGRCGRVVCPYHAWTYDLEGRLIGAGHMEGAEGFDKSAIALPAIRTEIWNGWIYVTLNDDAVPVAERLAGLHPVVAPYRMEGYVPVVHQDHVWRTNWKLLTENFMEGYHLPVAHKATVGKWFPVGDTVFPETIDPHFAYQTFTKSDKATYGRAHPDNTVLEGPERYTSVMPTVYPCHMYVLAPDHLWYLSLRPKGIGEVHVRFGVAVAPEVRAALGEGLTAWMDELVSFFDKVNAEDRFVVEGIFAGSRAPSAEGGPLSWLEREIHDFMGYIHRSLTGPST